MGQFSFSHIMDKLLGKVNTDTTICMTPRTSELVFLSPPVLSPNLCFSILLRAIFLKDKCNHGVHTLFPSVCKANIA